MIKSSLQIGQKAPYFSLIGSDGRIHSTVGLGNLSALVIYFSSNHCPSVKSYQERLYNLAREFTPRRVLFLGICSNNEVAFPEEAFTKTIEQSAAHDHLILYLHDQTQLVAKTYGAQVTPEVFLFDKELRLSYHGAIDDNPNHPELVKHCYLQCAINAVLTGIPLEPRETKCTGCAIKWRTGAY